MAFRVRSRTARQRRRSKTTRCLPRFELASLGITANIVHPPVTDTGWITDAVRHHVAGRPDLIHIAEPSEVAAIIAFLASTRRD
jgi:NAD(P)-dependent dehydrogenase (short-subunit alcohol dehydrogenase family)